MRPGISASRWLTRTLGILVLLYVLWWLAAIDQKAAALVKIALESTAPLFFSQVKSVTHAAIGGWTVTTTISPSNDASAVINLHIAQVFINKCMVWAPAALALVVASAPSNLGKISSAALIALCTMLISSLICIGAHLAVTLNGTPAQFDDGILPPPSNIVIDEVPYPVWYFHLITFANYLVVLIAPLMMPVVIWLLVCHDEVQSLLRKNQ